MTKQAHHNDGRGSEATGRGRRGSVDNAGRLAAFAQAKGRGNADWGGCDAAKIQAVICAITEMGGAMTVGLSRDQGAHSLTLLLDGERQTLWFNQNADLDAELDNVLAMLAAMRE